MQTIPMALLPFTRKAFPCDIRALKDKLRQDDMNDVRRLCGHTPEEALRLGWLRSSPCVAFFIPGKPEHVIGMGGLVPPGIAWALFHKDFLKHKEEREAFLKACPLVRDWFLSLSVGGFMHNVTLRENKRIRRWLKWLGALELPDTGRGPIHFYFTKKKEDNHHV
ncbi:MAG: hypothetical protein LUG19_05660 [Desulfovibrio sp.]|uniref:hypothetical protein n=1 Tax=Desulfovibrio sp. TaxID=885 RepID=UPI00258B8B45|nr:hypothetical protein [Desulfovibrio sp.]MCD7983727.1 hypothetical protein [Desulfovibrio sp.]